MQLPQLTNFARLQYLHPFPHRQPHYKLTPDMTFFNWIFFGPALLLASLPYAGFAIAAMLIGAQAARTLVRSETLGQQWLRKAPVFTGLLWVIFNLYELQIIALTAANKVSTLRIDLMVLTPLLYVLTAFAVYSLFARAAKQQTMMDDAVTKESQTAAKSESEK
jgi:hypothetical protein